MKKVMIPLATGFEEIEAVTLIDVLRRAGLEVIIVGLTERWVTGSHQIALQTDALIHEMNPDEFDMLVLPGGMPGAKHLRENEQVLDLVRGMDKNQKWIAAICAAPTVLQAAGVIRNRQVTSYPSFEPEFSGFAYRQDSVVIDENLATSRGPGTALAFALQLASLLVGEETAAQLTKTMLAR